MRLLHGRETFLTNVANLIERKKYMYLGVFNLYVIGAC